MIVLAKSRQQILPFTAFAYFSISLVSSSFRGSPKALIIFFKSASDIQPFQSNLNSKYLHQKMQMPQVTILHDLSMPALMQIVDLLPQTSSLKMIPNDQGRLISSIDRCLVHLGTFWQIGSVQLRQHGILPISCVGMRLFLFSSYTLKISYSFSDVMFIFKYSMFSSDILINIYHKIHMKMSLSTSALCFFAIIVIAHTQSFSAFEIVKAEKVVQLNGAYPIQSNKIEYHCLINGCGSKIYFALPAEYEQNLLKISFGKDKNDMDCYSHIEKTYQHNGEKFLLYEIDAGRQLAQDETFVVFAQLNFINRYVNFPQSIDLTEDQKFEYEDYKKFVSPYMVKESSIAYKFAKIISFDSDGEKKGLSGAAFKSTNTEPFTLEKHIVHGVNNQPQVVFSEVERIIEVSHWGNIAITEFYKLKNVGPTLKGEFSRVQFSSQNNFQAKNAWKGIETKLPYQIRGLYYRDEVGNISTSKAFRDHHNNEVRFAMVPRFALLGGWKSNFEIGYNLNTKGFLKHDGSNFELKNIPIEYAFSKILTQKYTIRVILPEGSQNTKLTIDGINVDMSKVQTGLNFGYLDFTGRTTYTIPDLRGVFTDKQLHVTYTFDPISIFMKPLRIFGAIFSVLVGLVILKRLNMSAFEAEPECVKKIE